MAASLEKISHQNNFEVELIANKKQLTAFDVMKDIESQYIEWNNSMAKTKEINCRINTLSFTVIFQRGLEIYPKANTLNKKIIYSNMNVTPNKVEVHGIFQSYFPKVKKLESYSQSARWLYSLPNNANMQFQLRFFVDQEWILSTIQREEEEHTPLAKPREGCLYRCSFL
jgi:hypothetical protein